MGGYILVDWYLAPYKNFNSLSAGSHSLALVQWWWRHFLLQHPNLLHNPEPWTRQLCCGHQWGCHCHQSVTLLAYVLIPTLSHTIDPISFPVHIIHMKYSHNTSCYLANIKLYGSTDFASVCFALFICIPSIGIGFFQHCLVTASNDYCRLPRPVCKNYYVLFCNNCIYYGLK